MLELRRAEGTTSALQIETQLQAAPVEQFPGVTLRRQGPRVMSPTASLNADGEVELMPAFTGIRTIPSPEVSVVDAVHAPTCEHVSSSHTTLCEKSSCAMC